MSVKSLARRGTLAAALAAGGLAAAAAPSFGEAVPLQPPQTPKIEGAGCKYWVKDAFGNWRSYTAPNGTVLQGSTCINGVWV
jgi:hypothetical protein